MKNKRIMNRKNLIYTVIAALLLAVVALLFFAPADFEGKVLRQHDMQQGMANGQETKVYEEETGEKTYWTGSLFSGMPTFQISPVYSSSKMMGWIGDLFTLWLPSPANILFGLMLGFFIMCLCMKMRWPVALFGSVAWGLSTYFIIIIGAGHIWKFLTLMYIPPTIGGIALLYRGKYLYGSALVALFGALQIMSNHVQMTYYFLFVIAALVIAWFVTAYREKELRRWGIATGCMIGAAGLAVVANLAQLYLNYEYSKETMRGRATEIEIEGKEVKDGLDPEYITQWSYGIGETWTLLIPNVKGGASVKPVNGELKPKTMLETETMQEASLNPLEKEVAQNYFRQYFGPQSSTNGPVYVGAFVLVLAILAMFVVDGKVLGPMKWALFAVSLLAVLLAWGHNFQSFSMFFIDNVPFYNKFRTPSSMLVVVEFCLPLLAVMAIVKMMNTPDFLQRYGMVFYVVTGVVAFVCFLGWVAPGIFGSPWSERDMKIIEYYNLSEDERFTNMLRLIADSRMRAVSQDSLRSLMFVLLGFGVTYLYLRGAFRSKPMFACALTAVVLIDLFSVNKRYIDNDSFTTPLPGNTSFTATKADKEILKDTDPNYRVYDADYFDMANSSYFHKTVGGYHAAKLTRYNDMITYQLHPELYSEDGNWKPNRMTSEGRPVLPLPVNMLNPRYIIYKGQAYRNPDAFGNAWLVDKVHFVDTPNDEMIALYNLPLRTEAVADSKYLGILGSSSQVSPGDTIYETSYAPGKLDYEVRSKTGGVAVFSEIYFPWGWEATIDGKPAEIGRVNYVLRALNIPPGEHQIHFEFKPKGLQTTNTLSVIAVSLIYLLCLCALWKIGMDIRKGMNPIPVKASEESSADSSKEKE